MVDFSPTITSIIIFEPISSFILIALTLLNTIYFISLRLNQVCKTWLLQLFLQLPQLIKIGGILGGARIIWINITWSLYLTLLLNHTLKSFNSSILLQYLRLILEYFIPQAFILFLQPFQLFSHTLIISSQLIKQLHNLILRATLTITKRHWSLKLIHHFSLKFIILVF